MKHIIRTASLLAAAALTAFAAGCTPDYGEMLKSRDLQLTADRDTITADGNDKVTLTVLQAGKDVTADAVLYLASGEKFDGNTFSTETPDNYAFYAEAYGKRTKLVGVTAEGTGELVLSCDKGSIQADGKDKMTFTVTKNGSEITPEAEIFMISEGGQSVKSESTFTSSETGGYRFYARSGNTVSDMVVVNVMEKDKDPELYDNFGRRSLLVQFTAQGCGPCAKMKEAVAILEEQGFEDGVIVACHTALMPDTMYPTFWKEIWEPCKGKMQGIPAINWNFIPESTTGNIGTPQQSAEGIIQTTAEMEAQYPAVTAISAISYGSGDKIMVHARIKFIEAGDYKVCAWLLEDGIMGYQQTIEGDINHHDVLRGKSSESPLGAEITAGTRETKDLDFVLETSDLMNGNPENTKVVIFVSKKQSGSYYIVNNAVKCGYNSSTGFLYE